MDDEILFPADLRPVKDPSAASRRLRPPPLWLGALLLLLLGLAAIFFLRGRLPEAPPPRPEPTPVPATPTPDPTARLHAEEALAALIAELRELRESRPELWAPEAWSAILEGQTRGNQALAERRFGEALEAYETARNAARRLRDELPSVPERLRSAALDAYAAGRGEEAVERLELLLTLQPGDAAAAALLPRARVAEQSHAALLESREALAQGAPSVAWLAFQRLESLDDAFPGLVELRAELRAALDADRGEAALRAERRAEQIARAQSLESAGDWAAATEAWLRVPDAVPEGRLADLRGWGALDERIRRAGTQPRSAQAAELENELRQQDPDAHPPALASRVRAFLELRESLRRPVTLRLRSDGETAVRILRVRDLPPFGETSLELLPGTYTLVGSRMGHRDVRLTLTLEPGAPETVLDIRATESLRNP